MDKKIYMAPMEGVTDSIYRRTFKKYFGGIDKYFTPFLAPNSTKKFPTREWKEIDPEFNDISDTVPQLLTNNSEHFLWAVGQIAPLGFKEINFNLGCPSPTVVTKKKGSGLLEFPEELDRLLYEIFDGLSSMTDAPDISIKTRIGKTDPEDFYEILEIYNKYPINELTVHPRITTDFYKLPVRPEFFSYAYNHAKMPLIYNGDLFSLKDVENCIAEFPDIDGVMLGRGLISDSFLAAEAKEFSIKEKASVFKAFHNELLEQYTAVLSGEKPVLFRMKEFWAFWEKGLSENPKAIKKIRKANKIADYKSAVGELL